MDLCNSCDQKQHGMMSSLTANHKRIPIKNVKKKIIFKETDKIISM